MVRCVGSGGRGATTTGTAVLVCRPLFTHPSPSGGAALVQRSANSAGGWWLQVECSGARGLTAGASRGGVGLLVLRCEHRGRGAPAGAAPRPTAKVWIAINKQITACKDVKDLCSVIQNRVTEFNHVNFATAFCKLLQTPRHGVAGGTVDQALRSLEESALHNIEDFGPQELANTLHAMAKRNYIPTNSRVIEALERQVEELAGTLNAKDVANMLWAYAKMGRKPGAGLEGRAEALTGTFNAQDMTNTLWAYATMGREPGCRPTPRRM